jgi:type II secretory pathway pseudopilin PulG
MKLRFSPLRPGDGATRVRGFSLVEVLISMTMLAGLLGTLLTVVSTGSSAARVGMARQSLEGAARRTLDRIASELFSAGAETLDPDPAAPWGSSNLSFQKIEGFDGEIVWGTPNAFSLALEEGELDNGEDDNGNGLIDERVLVYTRDLGGANELATVWVHGVRELSEGELDNGEDDNGNGLEDEEGLSFLLIGGRLTVRLTLEELDSEGNNLVRTVETSVRLRN